MAFPTVVSLSKKALDLDLRGSTPLKSWSKDRVSTDRSPSYLAR